MVSATYAGADKVYTSAEFVRTELKAANITGGTIHGATQVGFGRATAGFASEPFPHLRSPSLTFPRLPSPSLAFPRLPSPSFTFLHFPALRSASDART